MVYPRNAQGHRAQRPAGPVRRSPFKAGGRGGAEYYTDVPAGDIAIKNVADLYLYPNTVQAVVITGEEVRNWLEMSAGIFNRIAPGSVDASLINGDFLPIIST